MDTFFKFQSRQQKDQQQVSFFVFKGRPGFIIKGSEVEKSVCCGIRRGHGE
jgi:hypothetical protein